MEKKVIAEVKEILCNAPIGEDAEVLSAAINEALDAIIAYENKSKGGSGYFITDLSGWPHAAAMSAAKILLEHELGKRAESAAQVKRWAINNNLIFDQLGRFIEKGGKDYESSL